ncbi:3-hydroxyacyl-CoA dehydrogenase, C-terminal domain family protein [Lentisphaera araneosa HTCC2155]|uniref:3-hydroxyacyl-CoA dehydrogenase, C-terminal domain family protein n=1 Tax=Lentisphaera araneosa HTCC2155 TaxID=313628 RepID=A6DTH3_9BACT|nr:3-hydroxyacyl-CoA dehydrogenase/enoyl-CoA hydratase family protein [Lentisphaera araneosa]EDM25077.1 3-hydroxyacyl-CoA dehydrogenase, C-terminal domain family protein [Lentisphaera araneosa HTCC2155]
MSKIKHIAVLGSGVMGSQIAAHFANCGFSVALLDLTSAGPKPSAISEGAVKKLLKINPSPLYSPSVIENIFPGNFDDHLEHLDEADLIIEAVIEDLAIKQNLWSQICKYVKADAILATNTSGLPLKDITKNLSNKSLKRFLGVHFFNPPRYQKLLELIPGPKTQDGLLEEFAEFARLHLGKGIVVAKDTPNFIGNRIGCYAMQKSMIPLFEDGFTIEEIDLLTGPLMGRPKSATFRTLDLIGVDTILYVTSNLHSAIKKDECRNEFIMPTEIKKMVKQGQLGAKTKKGFYSKVDGEIRSINFGDYSYQSPKEISLENIHAYKKIPDLGKRLRALYDDPGRVGDFYRKFLLALMSYSARRIPEICHNHQDIDKAMKWGWAWQMGPFEIWQAIGFKKILNDLKGSVYTLPEWITRIDPEVGFTKSKSPFADQFTIKEKRMRLIKDYKDARLLNWKQGICVFEFTGKANTISSRVLDGIIDAVKLVEDKEEFKGILIANDSSMFSAGANLAEMAGHVQNRDFAPINEVVNKFQQMSQVVHYASKPVIPVVQGRALGGACEIIMAAPHAVVAQESYMGLVELGVGLIPAGGGTMRMAKLAATMAGEQKAFLVEPFLRQNWLTIAMAKVSASGLDAQSKRYLNPNATLVTNAERRLHVAAQLLLQLSELPYSSPRPSKFLALGANAASTFKAGAYNMLQSQFISKYDYFLACKLAHIICGGNLTRASMVDEQYILDLEREVFLSLLGEAKTLARIESILKFNRPLRN